ncbi:MAG: hypothetical protein ACMXYG_05515 [Candidatus Woesearchaeota archaeon]
MIAISRPPILSLKDDIQRINDKLKDYHIDYTPTSHIIPDGDETLALWKRNHLLGVVGISYGLESYYYELDIVVPENQRENYESAIEASSNRWIVTQVQANPGTLRFRQQYNFRRILMDFWDELMSERGYSIDLFLSAKMNYYMIPYVQDDLYYKGISPPHETGLKINYDYLAKRRGFSFNPETLLYHRN